MTPKRLLALVALPVMLLFYQTGFAQNSTISGKVTDSKDGSPVAGATVLPKGQKNAAVTGADGSFKLSVPQNISKLVISSIGYLSQEIDVTGKADISISLVASSTTLNEVVAIGYSTAKRKDLTGAVASLSSKNFNQGIVVAPDQLLQSKIAGVLVTTNSGEPGAGTTIQVRGNTSIRANNNPLYVIDGVPLDGRSAEPGANVTGFGSTPSSNPLLYINPNDISQIEVLKDASASAIYGSRGANGVVIITTKKGTSGPTKLEGNVSFGAFGGYMKKFDVLDAGQYKAAVAKYSASAPATIGMIDENGAKTTVPNVGSLSKNALKDIISSKITKNYSLAVSGGNENGRYRASFLLNNTEGFIKETGLRKYIGTFGATTYLFNKKVTLDVNLIAGNIAHEFGAISNSAGSQGNLMSSALQWNPTQSYTNAAGFYQFPSSGSGNPLAFLAAIKDKAITNTILGNISAAYKITKGLEYKFLFAINQSTGSRNTNYPGWLNGYTGISGSGLAIAANSRLNSQTYTHTLNYNVDLNTKFHLALLGGYEYWKSDFSTNIIQGNGFNTNLTQQTVIPVLYTSMMQNAKTITTSSYLDPTTELQSLFGRAILNYDDRYLVTATVRRDGSSKFGANNKYGIFPSFAAKWNISNEGFLKNSSTISNLAIRGSWGITGNQEFPSGSALEQYQFSSYNTAGQVNVSNPNVKWEETTSTNFGLDFELMHGKIYGTFDYYKKNTTNLLYQSLAIQPAPATSTWQNLPAKLINKGFEISLGANVLNSKDLGLDIGFNYSHNDNKLTEFKQALIQTGSVSGAGLSGALAQAIANNQPLSVFYLKHFSGFDVKGNQTVSDNPAFAGNPNPSNYYGVSATLRYKKLDFIVNGGGASGYLIFNNTATGVTNISNIGKGINTDVAAFNSKELPSSSAAASDRFLESGNFFKLRNATLRYRIGSLGKNFKNVNVALTGNNLFVITKFTGFDPEVSIDKSVGGYPSRSMEYIPYPTARSFVFSINFSL
jgi:TonB-dependent starch-binding outer membrane protein SusC